MFSSRRRAESPTSSCSSYSTSWGCYDDYIGGEVDAKRGREGGERVSVEDEREVARRVLEDLEGLYFDGSSDDESESEDGVDSSSEWGSETSSRSSSSKRKAGGMTLEELTVALNAAIEYHRPVKVNIPVHELDNKRGKHLRQSSSGHSHRSRPFRQENKSSTASSPKGETTFEFFQDMLERKQQHFYAMKAAPAPEEETLEDRQLPEPAQSHHSVVVNQQKQLTTLVRDQATETEEYFQYPRLDASFGVTDFQTPPHSPPPSIHERYMATPNELPITIGPSLADLAASHRRNERDRMSSRSLPGSESSWSSPSSSSAPSRRSSQLQSSYASKRSIVSSPGVSNSSSNSSSASGKSNASSRSRSSSSRTSGRSISSRNNHNSPSNEPQKTCRDSHQLVQASTQLLPDTLAIDKAPAPVVSPVSPDSPRIPSSPTLVNWELDLSNFAL